MKKKEREVEEFYGFAQTACLLRFPIHNHKSLDDQQAEPVERVRELVVFTQQSSEIAALLQPQNFAFVALSRTSRNVS